MAKINELGNIYGNLTVIAENPIRSKDGKVQWECQCKCGNIITVPGKLLRNGNTKSCGCLAKYREIGKKYNQLTVLSYSHTNERGELIWNCKCDCGNLTTAKTRDLKSGHKKSCGCLYSPSLIGQKFGKLTVIEKAYSDNKYIYWKCQCECGQTAIVSGTNLKTGNTSSCGCINYSIGERNIQKWLDDNHIVYKKEWVIPKSYCRFDFALFDKNNNLVMFIEFDGEQHYNDLKGVWGQADSLINIKKRDEWKNNYAKSINIPLVRIPYWERDNITTKTIFNPAYFVNN